MAPRPFTRHLCIATLVEPGITCAGLPAIVAIDMTIVRDQDERTNAEVCVTLRHRSDNTLRYELTVPEQSSADAAIEASVLAKRVQTLFDLAFDISLSEARHQAITAYHIMTGETGSYFGGQPVRVRIKNLFTNVDDGFLIFRGVTETMEVDHYDIRRHTLKIFDNLPVGA